MTIDIHLVHRQAYCHRKIAKTSVVLFSLQVRLHCALGIVRQCRIVDVWRDRKLDFIVTEVCLILEAERAL